jgi:hypothetical protein
MIKRVVMLATLFLLAAPVARAGCSTIDVTATTDIWYTLTGSKPAAISFEPDAAAAGATATVTLSMCVSNGVAASCLAYNFDSNGDGVADTNILSGLSTERSGVKNIQGFNFLRVQVGTSPLAGETPKVTFCQ